MAFLICPREVTTLWEEQTPLLPDVAPILSLGWHQTFYHLLPNKAIIICQLPAMGSSLPWAQVAKLQGHPGEYQEPFEGRRGEEVGWTMIL